MQPPLCGIGCQWILGMRRFLKIIKSFLKTHLLKVAFTDKSLVGFL